MTPSKQEEVARIAKEIAVYSRYAHQDDVEKKILAHLLSHAHSVRQETIEECAKVAETKECQCQWLAVGFYESHVEGCPMEIAEDIRNLKSKQEGV